MHYVASGPFLLEIGHIIKQTIHNQTTASWKVTSSIWQVLKVIKASSSGIWITVKYTINDIYIYINSLITTIKCVCVGRTGAKMMAITGK